MNRVVGAGTALAVLSAGLMISYIGWVQLSSVEEVHDGTAAVPPGGFSSFPFDVIGDSTEIYYMFEVQSGPSIDVYILSDPDYARYLTGLPIQETRTDFVRENVSSTSSSPYPAAGRYHAVIDNSDYGVARPQSMAASVRYYLLAGGGPGSLPVHFLVLGLTLLGLAVGLVVVAVGIKLPIGATSSRRCPSCGYVSNGLSCPRCRRPLSPT